MAESEADAIIAEIDEQPAAPPTSRELGEWIGGGNCPAEALEDAARSLGAMGVICCNSEGTPAIAYGSINPKTLRLESGLLHVELEASTIALRENGKRSIAGPRTVIRVEWPVRDIADRWITLDPDQQPEFPLTLLVQAWHSRRRPAMLSTRTTGRIIPAELGMATQADRRAGNPFSHAAHVGEGQLVLPGFQTDRTAPALPLQLYDLGLGAVHAEKSTGAPLALRIFVESILAVSQQDRRGEGPVVISMTLRDLLNRLEIGWEKRTPKSDKIERRRCQYERCPSRKIHEGIPPGSSEAGNGREAIIAGGSPPVVPGAIDVRVLGEGTKGRQTGRCRQDVQALD